MLGWAGLVARIRLEETTKDGLPLMLSRSQLLQQALVGGICGELLAVPLVRRSRNISVAHDSDPADQLLLHAPGGRDARGDGYPSAKEHSV